MWNQKFLLTLLCVFLATQQTCAANWKQQVFNWTQLFTKRPSRSAIGKITNDLCWGTSYTIFAGICHISYLGYKIEQKNIAIQKFYDNQANSEITFEAKSLLSSTKEEHIKE